MRILPRPEEWASAFGLTRRDGEWRGLCPLCGFARFYVGATDDGRAVVGCRRCIDHEPPDTRRAMIGELLHRAFPDGVGNAWKPQPVR